MEWWTSWGATAKDLLLASVALYGAVLSTVNWWQASKKERRLIKIAASTALPTYPDGSVGNAFAKVEAVNIGRRKVTIGSLGFQLEDGKRLFSLQANPLPGVQDTHLPVTLEDGDRAFVHFSYHGLGLGLARTGKCKIVPYCEDSAGAIYKGKPWDVDPAKFMGM